MQANSEAADERDGLMVILEVFLEVLTVDQYAEVRDRLAARDLKMPAV
jgi:hypothetical protein